MNNSGKEAAPLSRAAKIAMLNSLRNGSVSDTDRKALDGFLGREPIVLRFCGTEEEYRQIINEVPDL